MTNRCNMHRNSTVENLFGGTRGSGKCYTITQTHNTNYQAQRCRQRHPTHPAPASRKRSTPPSTTRRPVTSPASRAVALDTTLTALGGRSRSSPPLDAQHRPSRPCQAHRAQTLAVIDSAATLGSRGVCPAAHNPRHMPDRMTARHGKGQRPPKAPP